MFVIISYRTPKNLKYRYFENSIPLENYASGSNCHTQIGALLWDKTLTMVQVMGSISTPVTLRTCFR